MQLEFRVEHGLTGLLPQYQGWSNANRKIYRIKLTGVERETYAKVATGKRGKLTVAAWKVQRANAILKCDESDNGPVWQDQQIAEAIGITTRSLESWRKQAAEQGPLSLLERKQRQTPPRLRFSMQKRKLN